MTSKDDVFDQLEYIAIAQGNICEGKSKGLIDSIKKSERRVKNELKKLANDRD